MSRRVSAESLARARALKQRYVHMTSFHVDSRSSCQLMSYIVNRQKKNLIARQPHCDGCEHLEIEMTHDVSHLMSRLTVCRLPGRGEQRHTSAFQKYLYKGVASKSVILRFP